MKAENFELADETREIHKLSEYKGKWVVVYFYPKDDTPGCTKEACNFRDNLSELTKMGVVILGISKDSQKSHAKFKEKYHLNFPLLSDEGLETIKKYGAFGEKKFMGKTFNGVLRKTYLIDPNMNIAKVYDKVDVTKHAAEILRDIEELKN